MGSFPVIDINPFWLPVTMSFQRGLGETRVTGLHVSKWKIFFRNKTNS